MAANKNRSRELRKSLYNTYFKELNFSYYKRPTCDFRMEWLSSGNQVKILESKSLKQEIKEKLQKAYK